MLLFVFTVVSVTNDKAGQVFCIHIVFLKLKYLSQYEYN
jgi:hypothetical protein